MSRFLVSLAAASTVILVFSSCDDDPKKAKALSPTAPVVELSPAAELMDAPVKVKGSSVCASYQRERSKLLGQLTTAPENTELLKRAKALAAVITDACN